MFDPHQFELQWLSSVPQQILEMTGKMMQVFNTAAAGQSQNFQKLRIFFCIRGVQDVPFLEPPVAFSKGDDSAVIGGGIVKSEFRDVH